MYIFDGQRDRGHTFDCSVDIHEDIYQFLIQIDEDRYQGAYSGYLFTAWQGVRPSDLDASDSTCGQFWEKYKDKAVFGGGDSPQEAFSDLIKKLDDLGFYVVDDDHPNKAPLKAITLHGSYFKDGAMVYDSDQFREWVKRKDTKQYQLYIV